jgi:ribonuclease R
VVTGVEEFGLFAQGVDLPAEGLIHISSLQDDFYRFDRGSHTLTGNRAGNRYQLGDHVTVSVARVDVDRRELDFRIVAREKSPARKSRIGSKAERREKKGKAKGKSKTKPKGKRRK